ncbi:MAG: hypothetical protein ACYCY6_02605 [Minisyncoccota bacterium]
MNNKILILVGIIAIVCVTAIIGLSPVSKEYSSDKFGLKFLYTDKYLLEEKQIDETQTTIVLIEDTEENRAVVEGRSPGREGPTSITVSIFEDPTATTLREWTQTDERSNFKLSNGTVEEGMISNKESILYVSDGLYPTVNILALHRGRVMQFSVSYLTLEDEIRGDFSKILDSVEFY